jgi:hypothetical protein
MAVREECEMFERFERDVRRARVVLTTRAE